MKTFNKTLIALTLAGLVGGGAVNALAGNTKSDAKSAQGGQYASEVKSGTIQIKDGNDKAMAGKAKLSASEVAQIATKAFPGKVVESQLGNENGYLIWEVSMLSADGQETQIKLDAGDGRVLAVEAGEEHERHEGSREKYEHEDNDRDDHANNKQSGETGSAGKITMKANPTGKMVK